MVTPKVDLITKWKLEEEPFHNTVFTDVQSGKKGKWPRLKPVEQIAYENWLNEVVDPASGYYYPKRDEDGNPVKTGENPKHVVTSIVRYKRRDGKEFLLSKGYLSSFNSLGEPTKFTVSYPEKWNKTNFEIYKDWDPKKKAIVKECKGPSGTEEVYTLEFNKENLKSLYDKRENDYIPWTVKDDRIAKSVELQQNIEDTFKLFLKPFDYLQKAEYISLEMKAQYRQEAIMKA